METLAKYHVCNHCVIGEKTFKNILIGPGKLPGLSRNGPGPRLLTSQIISPKWTAPVLSVLFYVLLAVCLIVNLLFNLNH